MIMEKITAKNFVTDNRTNKLYISSLIDRENGALDARVRSKLKLSILEFSPNCELLVNTRDVWARDYMPIQLTKDVFLGYTYNPDYLIDDSKCVTNWQLHNVHTQRQLVRNEHFDFCVIQMPIILDGGNIVKAIVNNQPCIIMCDKILQENNVLENEFRIWWEHWWNNNFSGTEMGLVLLPWEGSDVNPIGHADGIVRYIEDGRVLMTNYADFDKRYKEDYGASCKKQLEEAGFKVESLSFLDRFNYENDKMFRLLFKHSWCYINFLQLGNQILVPSLGYEPLDREALRQINQAFNVRKQIADIQLIDVDMTSIVEDIGVEQNSGGALNCLTWTTGT